MTDGSKALSSSFVVVSWLSGWGLRKSHLIAHAADAGTNYQKQIIVHKTTGSDDVDDVFVGTHCRDDFGDIRFTDEGGNVLLDYYLASYVSGDWALFYVEVAADLSTVDQTVYLYYDKSDAATTSDGAATFDRFYDFDDESLPSWLSGLTGDQTPTFYASPAKGTHSYGAKYNGITTGTNDGRAWGISITLPTSYNSVRILAHHYGADYQSYFHQHTYYDTTLYQDYYSSYSSSYPIIDGWDFYTYPVLATGFSEVQLEFHKDHSTYARYKPTIIIDNLCIAKYVDPEPVNSTWGSEESAVPAGIKSLSSSFTIRKSTSLNMVSSFIIRKSSSKNLSSSLNVPLILGAADLSCIFAVSAAGLHSGSKGYSSSFTVKNKSSKPLSSKIIVRNAGSKALSARFGVAQYINLSSSFTIRRSATKALASSFIIRKSASKNVSSSIYVIFGGYKRLRSSFTIKNCYDLSSSFQVRNVPSSDGLSSSFTVQTSGSADVGAFLVVQQSSAADLSSSFLLRSSPGNNLSVNATIRNAGFVNYKTSFTVRGMGVKNLSCIFALPTIKNLSSSLMVRKSSSKQASSSIYVMIPASVNLHSSFVAIKSGARALSCNITVMRISVNYRSSFTVRQAHSAVVHSSLTIGIVAAKNLSSSLQVRHGTGKDLSTWFFVVIPAARALASSFTPRKSSSANMQNSLTVRNAGFKSYRCSFLVRGTSLVRLSANFTVTRPASANLSSSLVVYAPPAPVTYADLSSSFGIPRYSRARLSSSFTVRNVASKDLSSSFGFEKKIDLSSSFTIRKIMYEYAELSTESAVSAELTSWTKSYSRATTWTEEEAGT